MVAHFCVTFGDHTWILKNHADKQTDRQTNDGENRTPAMAVGGNN